MHYSIYFFAMDSDEFVRQMVESGSLSARVKSLISSYSTLDDETRAQLLTRTDLFLGGNLPDECDAGWFDVLCFIAETAAEKIDIPGFTLFKGSDFLDDVGVWPLFRGNVPPFQIPVHPDPPPEVGFLQAADLERIAQFDFTGLTDCEAPEAIRLRETFQEVAESVAEDQLDLLGVLLCN